MEDDVLTYRQVAAMLGVTLGTLYSLVSRKRIPHIRIGRRLVRFSRARISAWLAAAEVEPGNRSADSALGRRMS